MNDTPQNPPPQPPPEVPDVRIEQILEVMAAHTASNERVTVAVERLEATFPEKAEAILSAHRHELEKIPPPVIHMPEPSADPYKRLIETIYAWGGLVVFLIVAASCTILYFILTLR